MFKAIAFDLDDTLMDTSGLLIPKASAHAFEILIAAGLRLSPQECELKRLEIIKKNSHKEVFLHLAEKFGSSQTVAAVEQAIKAFYEPELPAQLTLLPGAEENLNYLQPKYPLFLVTAGTVNTQHQKADALGISKKFNSIYVINSLNKQRKAHAFLEIIKNTNIKPAELLCIGNSLLSEIADAIKIGATACYFEFGEERGAMPQLANERPQYHIRNHHELIPVCKL